MLKEQLKKANENKINNNLKNEDTSFGSNIYVDGVKKDSFNNYSQRSCDFGDLERNLLC
ncbi:hypothetical protein [Clostridium cochlearium]|uniref:hypothetical protein n=1 Tax=Clostridium cochlearium TaxID=1494 RepID=UPI00156F84AB|nr:hypothetical protein [Clostridium cochlearium]MBV1820502.1 hypothetical protein [Bacteroidales bacterium MSK.15.36]MCG4572773.1 hypothetical protein [Clostridium cochlearium]MCG4580702.1 hypothetical protein [Clostridium cochlearium]NSJ92568.1 hypothetical protein [Coprococcus sp. MSK.21.13]